jgi:hypothetical protein
MRYAVIAAALALIATGCSKKKKTSEDESATAAETQPSAENTSPAEQTREARRKEYMDKRESMKRRRVPMPITVDDVTAHVPTVDWGEPLGELTAGPNGRQVTAELCLTVADAADAASKFETTLEASGWKDVNARAARKGSGVGLSGQKPPLRVTVMIRSASPRCEGKAGTTHALLRFHKLLTKDQARPSK